MPPVAEPCPPLSAIFLDSGWRFRFDPADVGLTEAWFSPNTDDSEWIDLAPGEPWEFSGHDYDGIAWYRTKVTLPDWSALYLGIGGIDDAATLWVDGKSSKP